jgi:outer membrane protein OmpA-like peptidoglycan-associated protein
MRRRLLLSAPLLFGLAACETGTRGTSAAPQTFPIFFSEDSARLGENAQAIVASAANAARANPQAPVAVHGFAAPDSGSAQFNRALSEARAQAVADGLVAAGVPRSRIRMEPRGAVPFELLPTESRRVEIQVGG